jgi:hypothetical protein
MNYQSNFKAITLGYKNGVISCMGNVEIPLPLMIKQSWSPTLSPGKVEAIGGDIVSSRGPVTQQ